VSVVVRERRSSCCGNELGEMSRYLPDLTLPGYRYLGPFNRLDKGPPQNVSDAAAREHDVAYERYIEEGLNPYFNYNEADEEFLEKVSREGDYGGRIATGLFNLKKRFFPRFNGLEPVKVIMECIQKR